MSETFEFLPVYKRETYAITRDLPVYLVIDQKVREDTTGREYDMLITALEYVSNALREQVGFGIRICGVEYIGARSLTFSHIQPLFKSLILSLPQRQDTITIGIFEPDDPVRFYQKGFTDQIGLSDMVKRNILIASLSPPNNETAGWKAFMNGHSILHEIGHLLGAIHVSDLNSIMNTHTTWVGSIEFDSLNQLIINSYGKTGFEADDIAEHIEFWADCINRSGYKKSDFPVFFYDYMEANKLEIDEVDFGIGNKGRSIEYAVEGYRHLIEKQQDSAELCFYRALNYDSTQATIHYYLSKTTGRNLSELHLKKAADLGFYKAVFELVRSQFK